MKFPKKVVDTENVKELKKLLAQKNRELEIEAALERVRSRTMAMQHSDELGEVVNSIFNALKQLDYNPHDCTIFTFDFEKEAMNCWSSVPAENGLSTFQYLIPIIDHPFIDHIISSFKKKQNILNYHLAGEEKESYDDLFFQAVNFPEMEVALRAIKEMNSSFIFMSKGAIATFTQTSLSENDLKILERFSKVVDLSYSRFLDLKKAEAQAREAQIEAALERVRSRTMGMHRSDELLDTAQILFQQLQELGIGLHACGFSIPDQDSPVGKQYLSLDGTLFPEPIPIRFDVDPYLMKAYEYWKKGKTQLIFDIQGEELKNHLARNVEQFKNLGSADILANQAAKYSKGRAQQPQRLVVHHAFFRHGILFLTNDSPIENIEILLRFAKVFEQTYTRFLDLQNAEAQAREAQIEAALERVRSRSMGMHKSEELKDVVKVIFDQLAHLNINAEHAGIVVDYEPKKDWHFWIAETQDIPAKVTVPYLDLVWDRQFTAAKKKGKDFFTTQLDFDEKNNFYKVLLPHIEGLTKKARDYYFNCPGLAISTVIQNDIGLYIENFSGTPYTMQENDILMRFAKVFQQTYTRFLDLQKAEAQAREAQIEAALESVRAASMAMHKSDELKDVVGIVFEKLMGLGFELEKGAAIILTFIKGSKDHLEWIADPTQAYVQCIRFPYFENPLVTDIINGWEEGTDYYSRGYSFKVKNDFFSYAFEHTDYKHIPDRRKEILLKAEKHSYSIAFEKNSAIGVPDATGKIFSKEKEKILKRFAHVFEQAYTRFLDLQKAEALARESEIQLALERVRARTMAMHKSDELVETSSQMFQQLELLGIKLWTFGFNVWVPNRPLTEAWSSSASADIMWKMQVPHDVDPVLIEIYEHRNHNIPIYYKELKGEKLQRHIEYMFGLIGETSEEIAKNEVQIPSEFHFYAAYFKDGYLLFVLDHKITEADDLFPRFAKVFEQTYTRFLDLQKAESQAREAQIEAALERIRSASMAMHKSEELPQVALTFLIQIEELAIPILGVGLSEINPETNTCVTYFADNTTEGQNRELSISKEFELNEFWLAEESIKQMKSGKKEFTLTAEGERLELWIKWIDKIFSKKRAERLRSANLDKVYFHTFQFHEYSSIIFSSLTPLPEEYRPVIQRLVTTFKLSYLRFLDLKKAEAQSREAQIEASMERIRSRSLAMRTSDEIMDVMVEIRRQIDSLGQLDLEASVVHLYEKGNPMFESIAAVRPPGESGNIVLANVFFPVDSMDRIKDMMDYYWSDIKEYTLEFDKEMAEEWQQVMLTYAPMIAERRVGFVENRRISDHSEYWNFADFSEGSLLLVTHSPASADTKTVLRKAAQVFDFAYRRFRDLQKAEARALQAIKEASLDRVRGVISSMRSAGDLDVITPLIFKELMALGVPFIRCGVFIINEKEEIVEAYLSSPDGKSLGVLRLPYHASELTIRTVEAWQRGEVYRQHWNKEDFVQWIHQLMEQDQIQDSRTYQGAAAPPESLDLHFVPFTQGMLYVGNVNPLDEKELELVQSLAKAFSIAFARYEDFVKLEKAKAEVESAMSELKATQSQLIQQEKLASLGQLTAGIAHEIKNPLNFVNNFSEVSMEMIEEIKEERAKSQETRDETLVDEILEDIQSNLGKIHEHGSRANGIVTSMLQHSRGGSGKKEPTDLNALIKEYVNLSFHGMRAGKNPINVEFVLDLDPGLGTVSLINEDFTRVIINLCNNAFDAMRMKTLGNLEEYLPKLTVRTKADHSHIFIEVADNGPGIPDEIKDKILQPFFTTKKGTEGTGLGLSITHDIIKAHGGELIIESTIGLGTAFIIQLST